MVHVRLEQYNTTGHKCRRQAFAHFLGKRTKTSFISRQHDHRVRCVQRDESRESIGKFCIAIHFGKYLFKQLFDVVWCLAGTITSDYGNAMPMASACGQFHVRLNLCGQRRTRAKRRNRWHRRVVGGAAHCVGR